MGLVEFVSKAEVGQRLEVELILATKFSNTSSISCGNLWRSKENVR